MTAGNSNLGNDEKKKYKYRRFLSQFLASSAKNLITLDNGLFLAIPAIIIPALTGISNEHNRNEFLKITPAQASFVGSLGFITKPLGSFISGIITDPWGRKHAMIFLNIFYAIGWYTLYQASNIEQVFIGIAILGLSIGLTEPPIVAYLGEICEPSLRGAMVAYQFWLYSCGMLLVYLLNGLMAWRTVCLTCLTVPIISAISISFIPESPQWYLSKNRFAEAEKSLRWLRGWVSSEDIAEEFNELKRYSIRSTSCSICIKENLKCVHPLPTLGDRFRELKRKQSLKPMFVIFALFFFALYSGILSLKAYLIQILKAYDSPISPDQALTIMSFLDTFGTFAYIFLIRYTGKRPLYLFYMAVVFVCTVILVWFGFTYLPAGHITFDQANREPFHLENNSLGYIPLVCLVIWSYCATSCIHSYPWMILSELLPYKIRSLGNGILGSIFYLGSFITTKTYYNLETTLSLQGVTVLYSFITLFGFLLMYNILPETENRSLEDIELHFADNSKSITDYKMSK